MESQKIQKARIYSFEAHEGQLYGTLPYCSHLMDVVKVLIEFRYDDENLIMAAYLHDIIEETENTKEVLSVLFNEKVANLVDAVSGTGANRKEKKAVMISKLKEYPKAVPLKMADRLANMRNCASNNKRMLGMYVKELPDYADLFENCDPKMYKEMLELCKEI